MDLPIVTPADPITLRRAHETLAGPRNETAVTRVLAYMYSMLEHRLQDAVNALQAGPRNSASSIAKSYDEAAAVARGLLSGVSDASSHPLICNVRSLLVHVVDRLGLSDDRLAAAEECLRLIRPVSLALTELLEASHQSASAPRLHS